MGKFTFVWGNKSPFNPPTVHISACFFINYYEARRDASQCVYRISLSFAIAENKRIKVSPRYLRAKIYGTNNRL